MAVVFKAIGSQIRDIRIHHNHGDQPFAFVEDLHAESGGDFADARVHEVARVHSAFCKGEGDVCGGGEVGEEDFGGFVGGEKCSCWGILEFGLIRR